MSEDITSAIVDQLLLDTRDEDTVSLEGVELQENPFLKELLFKGPALDPSSPYRFLFFEPGKDRPLKVLMPAAVRVKPTGTFIPNGSSPKSYAVDLYLEGDPRLIGDPYVAEINKSPKVLFLQTKVGSDGRTPIGKAVGIITCIFSGKAIEPDLGDKIYTRFRCLTLVSPSDSWKNPAESKVLPAYVKPTKDLTKHKSRTFEKEIPK